MVAKRVGRLLGQNSRAAGLFHTEISDVCDGRASLQWKKTESWRDWAALSEGCYLLRSNVTDGTRKTLKAYIQLTEAEAAFRIHKSDLRLRRSGTNEKIACWPTSGLLPGLRALEDACAALPRAGLGHEPRRVFDELAKSSWSTWSCRPAKEQRSAAVALPSLQTTKPSC